MKKLCALLALMFVLSLAGGVFGQNNRNTRDRIVLETQTPLTPMQANREWGQRRHRRHRRHRTNRGNRNNNRP